MRTMVQNIFRDGQRTILWLGCACVGTYIAYQYWRKRELKLVDEGFEEVSKIDDNHEKRVLLVGLDGAGKTSIMDQVCMANGDGDPYIAPPRPTQGSTVFRLKNGSYTYNVWDIGGASNTRKYWATFLQDTDLLIFVVDASDTNKLSLAVSMLKQLLGDSRMDTVPILVIANKQDYTNALRPDQVKEALDLLSISPLKHKVEVIKCQTRPFPEEKTESVLHTWHHSSIDVVRKKIFSMAT
ncbi:hypothetical protein KM043_006882 [Ampulex compressa]|nr:hypothetical protein KM043_006882 [Ampulex compressa]